MDEFQTERERMAAFLKAKKIPQFRVAELAKTTAATVSRFLSGERWGRRETTKAIRKALVELGYRDSEEHALTGT